MSTIHQTMQKFSPTAKRRARQLALQALYQWHITRTPPATIETEFIATRITPQQKHRIAIPHFLKLLHCVPQEIKSIDACMQTVLDRPCGKLSLIELIILRIGIYEILYRPEIPYKVSIDEALRLANLFGAEKGYKYINAVLDNIAKQAEKGTVRF